MVNDGLHLMIDIETMGVTTSSPMFEFGACVFDLNINKIVNKRFVQLSLLDVMMETGFMPSVETLTWWRENNKYVHREHGHSLKHGLIVLDELFRLHKIAHVWANSPSFDLEILKAHYQAVGQTVPWTFNQERDYRTMKWLYRYIGLELPVAEVQHSGLVDAQQQTENLFVMMEAFNV